MIETLTQYWWIGLIVVALIIIFLIRRKIKHHKHKWFTSGYLVLKNDKPRMILFCDGCRRAVHVPVYTKKQLREIEGE